MLRAAFFPMRRFSWELRAREARYGNKEYGSISIIKSNSVDKGVITSIKYIVPSQSEAHVRSFEVAVPCPIAASAHQILLHHLTLRRVSFAQGGKRWVGGQKGVGVDPGTGAGVAGSSDKTLRSV